jgi:hypothetical protein
MQLWYATGTLPVPIDSDDIKEFSWMIVGQINGEVQRLYKDQICATAAEAQELCKAMAEQRKVAAADTSASAVSGSYAGTYMRVVGDEW